MLRDAVGIDAINMLCTRAVEDGEVGPRPRVIAALEAVLTLRICGAIAQNEVAVLAWVRGILDLVDVVPLVLVTRALREVGPRAAAETLNTAPAGAVSVLVVHRAGAAVVFLTPLDVSAGGNA
jgi:hypothetical protein